MEPLPKIPTPPMLVWRELRHRFFPTLVFGCALVAAAALWRQQATAPHLIGEVQVVSSPVTTGDDGLLLELHVDRFSEVAAGDPIAELRVSDPDSTRMELATMSAELQMLQTRMMQDQQRILQDFEQLRLNWLQERVELATARVELQFDESELVRIGKLAAEKLVSIDVLEQAQSRADSRRTEVAERTLLVAEIDGSLKRLTPDDSGRFDAAVTTKISESLAAHEQLLREANKTVTLRAPIAGVVTLRHHLAGERVRRGDPIVTITATKPEHIVGYLRPPLNNPPKLGDTIEVRTRAQRRQIGLGKVMRVGQHLEVISTNLAAANFGANPQGLPLLISLPENLSLLPGEQVDLAVRPQ